MKVIAIDGPAGSGKSTIAQRLASRLGIIYFDSGAIYRSFTFAALKQKGDWRQESLSAKQDYSTIIDHCADHLNLQFSKLDRRVFYQQEDITDFLRNENITKNINIIANVDVYRQRANSLIRMFAADSHIVIDGRDIGTVVFPNSRYKFYLDASPTERARRRYQELLTKSDVGHKVLLKDIEQNMRQRDALDMNREVAPLTKAADAIIVDSDGLTISEVVDLFLQHIKQIDSDARS